LKQFFSLAATPPQRFMKYFFIAITILQESLSVLIDEGIHANSSSIM